MSEPSPTIIRDALVNYFSLGELRTLCFDLGIDYEDLEGSNKQGKTLALVQYAQRHNRYSELVNAVRQARPHLNLDVLSTSAAAPARPQPTAGQPAQQPNIIVQGDYIAGDKAGGDKVKGDKITVGNISGSTGVAIGRGASAQVTIGGVPENKDEFNQQLQELKALLEQAIASGELDREEGETSLEDLQDVLDETGKDTPRTTRLTRRLEDVAEVVNAAGKTGAAVLRAAPIVAGLIKAASVIF